MKKYISVILSVLFILSLAGCSKTADTEPETPSQDYFNAVVLEVNGDMILAECTECESGAILAGNEVSINMNTISSEEVPLLSVGDSIRVVYIGDVMESDPLQLQEVISVFWIDENGEIVTSGAEITDIKHEPLETPDWGITLTAKEVTPLGLTLVCSQTGAEVNGELMTGSDYTLSKHVDGEWVNVEYLEHEQEVAWTAEAWGIPNEDTVEWEVNWEWLYGELPAGQYRISKGIMNLKEPGKFDTAVHYAEFEIGDTAFDIQKVLEEAEREAASLEKKLMEDASLTQADMNTLSNDIYLIWDGVLNDIWTNLKSTLDEEAWNSLLEEQRAWISDKEAEVKQAAEEVGGGSMAPLVANQRAAELTKERVYELAAYFGL